MNNGINLMDGGHNFFQTKPGPYDYWAIEYAYSELPINSIVTENEFLDESVRIIKYEFLEISNSLLLIKEI